jgi:hypothetical protein
MIQFKKRVQALLPYDRKDYIEYLEGENSFSTWYGVSFQYSSFYYSSEWRKNSLEEFARIYVPFFKNVVSRFDSDACWIVNHDDKDLKWFPNEICVDCLKREVFLVRFREH